MCFTFEVALLTILCRPSNVCICVIEVDLYLNGVCCIHHGIRLQFIEKWHDLSLRFLMLIGKTYFTQCNWLWIVSALCDSVLNSIGPAGTPVRYIRDVYHLISIVFSNDST